jgi:hypothetical protein
MKSTIRELAGVSPVSFSSTPMEPDDETAISDITILPDGRIFVLGASRQVLEILEVLSPEDAGLKQRLKRTGGVEYLKGEVGDDGKIAGNLTNSVQEQSQP